MTARTMQEGGYNEVVKVIKTKVHYEEKTCPRYPFCEHANGFGSGQCENCPIAEIEKIVKIEELNIKEIKKIEVLGGWKREFRRAGRKKFVMVVDDGKGEYRETLKEREVERYLRYYITQGERLRINGVLSVCDGEVEWEDKNTY